MSNSKKIAEATLATGGTLFATGAFITLGCAYYDLAKGIPEADYALDFNSAAGTLHTSAAILVGVGAVLMLAAAIYLQFIHKEKDEELNKEEAEGQLNTEGQQLKVN